MIMNPKVDTFLRDATSWKEEFAKLRGIILDCGLTEELKWGQPCYTLDGKNILLIHGFKEYCAILFIKGSLLKDTKGLLIQQTENVQAGRQIRFPNVKEIEKIEKTLKSYIHEAIAIERAGQKVEFKKTAAYIVPVELQQRLDSNSTLKAAFDALTPGRQKGYIYYISQAKQSKTREARVEKCIPKILDGTGLDD